MSEDRGTLSSVVTFLAGMAIGAGIALLYAPQSGAETRKKIKDSYEKVSDDVKDAYDRVAKEAHKAADAIKLTADKAISQVKSFLDGAKDDMKTEIKAELAEEAKKKPALKA